MIKLNNNTNEKLISFAKRNSILILLSLFSIMLLNPGTAELRTLLFIVAFELIAIGLSGLAVYLYTEIKFTQEVLNDKKEFTHTLGYIFLGVHITIGLALLGTYYTQFTG